MNCSRSVRTTWLFVSHRHEQCKSMRESYSYVYSQQASHRLRHKGLIVELWRRVAGAKHCSASVMWVGFPELARPMAWLHIHRHTQGIGIGKVLARPTQLPCRHLLLLRHGAAKLRGSGRAEGRVPKGRQRAGHASGGSRLSRIRGL